MSAAGGASPAGQAVRLGCQLARWRDGGGQHRATSGNIGQHPVWGAPAPVSVESGPSPLGGSARACRPTCRQTDRGRARPNPTARPAQGRDRCRAQCSASNVHVCGLETLSRRLQSSEETPRGGAGVAPKQPGASWCASGAGRWGSPGRRWPPRRSPRTGWGRIWELCGRRAGRERRECLRTPEGARRVPDPYPTGASRHSGVPHVARFSNSCGTLVPWWVARD
jgi:hypothetical protein